MLNLGLPLAQMKRKKREAHKSARVIIARCFRIPKCFQYIIGLKNLIFYPTTPTTTTSESSQILHCNFSRLSFPSSTFPTERKKKRWICMLSSNQISKMSSEKNIVVMQLKLEYIRKMSITELLVDRKVNWRNSDLIIMDWFTPSAK